MCPCRSDSHQPPVQELAGKRSFPQLPLKKSKFFRKGYVPCTSLRVEAEMPFSFSFSDGTPVFQSETLFHFKTISFRFKRDSKAPQYIETRWIPNYPFSFLFSEHCFTKKIKIQMGFCRNAGCMFFLQILKIYHQKVSLSSGQLQLV